MLLVLAILAAVALPRFADVQAKARESRVKAAAGSMQAVAGLVRTSAVARGHDCDDARGSQLEIDGTPVALTRCYPQPLAEFGNGILAAAKLDANGWAVSVRSEPAGPALVLAAADAADPLTCTVSYAVPPRAAEAPRVTTQLSGC